MSFEIIPATKKCPFKGGESGSFTSPFDEKQ